MRCQFRLIALQKCGYSDGICQSAHRHLTTAHRFNAVQVMVCLRRFGWEFSWEIVCTCQAL